MTTPLAGDPTPPWSLRSWALVIMVIAALLVAAVDAQLIVRSPSSSWPTVGWWPADGFPAGPKFDPSQAQTMTVVPIDVDWLECFTTPRQTSLTTSMLAKPEVSYTGTSVIVTMRFNDPTGALNTCISPNGARHFVIVLDVGLPVEVHLDSPLRGRTLLDGSTDPPRTPQQRF